MEFVLLFRNNTWFSTIMYTFSMWRFRKEGLHSCFLIYAIFLSCLGYDVEWGAELRMMDFEGLKGGDRDLAKGAVAGNHLFARLE
jgi:hypothetical protein